MFQGVAKKLRGVTDAFPFRVRAESFDFVSPDVGVGFGFQIAIKVPASATVMPASGLYAPKKR